MKPLLAALAFSVPFLAAPAWADQETMTPEIMADIVMAERLIALGEARGEPLLVLAAVRLRATLGGESAVPDGFTDRETALDIARRLSDGDEALIGIVEDVDADGSRRLPICARNGFCY
ncbi:hypothetical protein DXV76_16630 [Rhodobacteraceae bacterium CCMM004]|nr:hypothetical protein DXV76_16630 [Rhodobacteraceae bacterium CCMM004]